MKDERAVFCRWDIFGTTANMKLIDCKSLPILSNLYDTSFIYKEDSDCLYFFDSVTIVYWSDIYEYIADSSKPAWYLLIV